ncbi:MAG: hypothetical protein NT167_28295 [Verrucomicrobia bacterium]|nr:hypothetical protein [Verrucomicrobiota bacterium]
MKRNSLTPSLFAQRIVASGVGAIGLGILVIVMAGEIGFAASKLGTVQVASAAATGGLILLEPGAIGVTTDERPAIASYDPPRGQIERGAHGAGEAAYAVLEAAALASPEVTILVSAAGVVAAPFAAVIGGAYASFGRLPQDELAPAGVGLCRWSALMFLRRSARIPDSQPLRSWVPFSKRASKKSGLRAQAPAIPPLPCGSRCGFGCYVPAPAK